MKLKCAKTVHFSPFQISKKSKCSTYLCSVRPTKRLHCHIETFQQQFPSHFVLIYKCLVYSFNFFLTKEKKREKERKFISVIHFCSVPQVYFFIVFQYLPSAQVLGPSSSKALLRDSVGLYSWLLSAVKYGQHADI